MAPLALGAALVTERALRRFLPLAMLLRMDMAFPGRAPSRFAVARKARSQDQLMAMLAERDAGPQQAAHAMMTLLAALAGHDRRTRGHSERTRVLADVLGAELKLTRHDRDRLRWAALLHDIGKLEIAPRILNKPSPLDQSEWRRMQLHPEHGVELTSALAGWLGLVGRRDPAPPREVRRLGLPVRHRRTGDLARRPGHLGRRRLREHDGGAPVPEGACDTRSAAGTGPLCRNALRPRRGPCLPRHLDAAPPLGHRGTGPPDAPALHARPAADRPAGDLRRRRAGRHGSRGDGDGGERLGGPGMDRARSRPRPDVGPDPGGRRAPRRRGHRRPGRRGRRAARVSRRRTGGDRSAPWSVRPSRTSPPSQIPYLPLSRRRRRERARQGQGRQGQARQGQARQGQARQGQARQGQARQDKPDKDKPGKDKPGKDKPDKDKPRKSTKDTVAKDEKSGKD